MKDCLHITKISDRIRDGWTISKVDKQISFLAKSEVKLLDQDKVLLKYHVIYDDSYQVPVLYFSVTYSSGKVVKPADLTAILKTPNKLVDAISQKDHPLLDTPYYFIHPCQTSRMMKNFCNKQLNFVYLLTFLSSVGPVAGLYIPHAYIE